MPNRPRKSTWGARESKGEVGAGTLRCKHAAVGCPGVTRTHMADLGPLELDQAQSFDTSSMPPVELDTAVNSLPRRAQTQGPQSAT